MSFQISDLASAIRALPVPNPSDTVDYYVKNRVVEDPNATFLQRIFGSSFFSASESGQKEMKKTLDSIATNVFNWYKSIPNPSDSIELASAAVQSNPTAFTVGSLGIIGLGLLFVLLLRR